MKRILVTGAAGFIGSKSCELLLRSKKEVIGIDNMNNYYDVRLKQYRLSLLKKYKNFKFYKVDIEDVVKLRKIFKQYKPDAIINLAARAGVRASIESPQVYVTTNVLGTVNLLELCKEFGIKKFVLASTSSLYAGQKTPFKEILPVNTPISPYAASKKGAEMMCYTYHYLFGIDVTIVRYFTVYGPAGRPDMSILKFINAVSKNKILNVYGDGSQSRDFTYIDDIAIGTVKALKKCGFSIINLGNSRPHKLSYLIKLISMEMKKSVRLKMQGFEKSDMKDTWADIRKAKRRLHWSPKTDLKAGVKKTVAWFESTKNRAFIT